MRVDTVGVISCNGINKFFCILCVKRERASVKEMEGGGGESRKERGTERSYIERGDGGISYSNTLHKDNDFEVQAALKRRFLFNESVSDDKHSNTQHSKLGYK